MDARDIPWANGAGSGDTDTARAIRVADEMDRQRAQREAKRRLDAEERGLVVVPTLQPLPTFLAAPRPVQRYRIAGWWPLGGRVILAAQFKSGKTTLVGNVIRSLVDGDPFLGREDVIDLAGTVALLDLEMWAPNLAGWLDAQAIQRADRVQVVSLRGTVAAFNPLDAQNRAEWAARFRAAHVKVLIYDCLRPNLDALGLDEHRDAGRFLVGLDALLAEAEIPELLVVHHMGHLNERARGDSRLRDWPDVEWRLVRQDDDPASARYLSAYGRDVDQSEQALTFDPEGRRLTIGSGSRKDALSAGVLDDVLAVLGDEALSGRAIEEACRAAGMEAGKDAVRAALAYGIRTGAVVTEPGPRRATLHRKARVRGSARLVRENTASECAAPYIEGAHSRTHLNGVSARADDVPIFDPSLACVLPPSEVPRA